MKNISLFPHVGSTIWKDLFPQILLAHHVPLGILVSLLGCFGYFWASKPFDHEKCQPLGWILVLGPWNTEPLGPIQSSNNFGGNSWCLHMFTYSSKGFPPPRCFGGFHNPRSPIPIHFASPLPRSNPRPIVRVPKLSRLPSHYLGIMKHHAETHRSSQWKSLLHSCCERKQNQLDLFLKRRISDPSSVLFLTFYVFFPLESVSS